MCVMVYLASAAPLPLVPEGEGPIVVEPLLEDHEVVRSHFTREHVRYVGAYEGCGCGSQLGEYLDFLDDDERDEKRASLDALATYLTERLRECASLELFAAWDGEQGEPVASRRTITQAALREDDFFFRQHELVLVRTER